MSRMVCVLKVIVIIFEAVIHSQVAALPKGGDIEIEAVAIIGQWRFAHLQILSFFMFQEPWMWALCCSIKHTSTISK